MGIEGFRKVCEEGFRRVGSFYYPTDFLKVGEVADGFFCEYLSRRYSFREPNGTTNNSTGIRFYELFNGSARALIDFLGVHNFILDWGIDRDMVEVAESVFKSMGHDRIYASKTHLEEFWLDRGYKRTEHIGGNRFRYYKVLR